MNYLCDYHIHSCYSPEEECISSLKGIVDKAMSLGLHSIGVSDHLHARINEIALRECRVEFDKVKRTIDSPGAKLDFHFGVEVSVLREWDLEENEKAGAKASVYGVHQGGPANSPLTIYLPDNLIEELAFEYVIGGAHWPLGVPMKQQAIIESYHSQNMFLATHPHIDIVAHPWWWMGHWQDERGHYLGLPWLGNFSVIPDSMHQEFVKAVIEHNKAVEINAGAILLNFTYPDSFKQEYIKYLKKLRDWGVTFSLGSDAHSKEKIGSTLQITDILKEIGLTPSSLWTPVKNNKQKYAKTKNGNK